MCNQVRRKKNEKTKEAAHVSEESKKMDFIYEQYHKYK